MEQVCNELGLSMSAAFTVFARKVGREKRIPFDVSVDPFYSEENMARLRKAVNDLNEGKGTVHEVQGKARKGHELQGTVERELYAE